MLSPIKKYFLKNCRFLGPIALMATALLSGSNESQDKKKDLVKTRVAIQRLQKLEKLFTGSDFFKNLSEQKKSISSETTTQNFIKDSLSKIFSSSDKKDESLQNALRTISLSYGFFATPPEDRNALTKYLKYHQQSDILLNLIGAMDQLGLKNIDHYKIILEDTLRQLIDKKSLVVTIFNYKQLLDAFTYLDKDRKIPSEDPFFAWFKSTYKSFAIKAEITEFILPYTDIFFKSFQNVEKKDTDSILTQLLLNESKEPVEKPVAQALLVLHTHLIFFSTDDLDKIKNYLQSLKLDTLITLVEALDFLMVEKIDKKADVLEQTIVEKIKKEGVKKETYRKLLETLELLSTKTTGTLKHTLSLNELSPQVLPLTEKNPTCTFHSDPEGSYFIGADFINSGKDICLTDRDLARGIFPVDTKGTKLIKVENDQDIGQFLISPDGNIITWLYVNAKGPIPTLKLAYNLLAPKGSKAKVVTDSEFTRFIETYIFSKNSKSFFISFLPTSYYTGEDIYGLMSKIDAYPPRKLIFWFSDPELNPDPTIKFKRAHATTVTSITCSPDGTFVVSTAKNDPIVKVWDAHTGKLLKMINFSTPALSAAISKDSALIAMGGENGIIFIWDYKNNKLFDILKTNSPVCGLDWSPDGKILLVRTKETNNDISLWSVEKKVLLSTLDHPLTKTEDRVAMFRPKAIFSPDGNLILAGNAHEVTLWQSQPQVAAVEWFKTTYKMLEPVLNKKK